MSLIEKSDEDIIKIAEPIWNNLVKSSNIKDYGGFTKDFSARILAFIELSFSLKSLIEL